MCNARCGLDKHRRPTTKRKSGSSSVPSKTKAADALQSRIEDIVGASGAEQVAVAFHDYETDTTWDANGDTWFHAASTIKVPILLGVFAAIERGDLAAYSRLHVRNRFLSAADGKPFRLDFGRDANAHVPSQLGKTMRVEDLAHHMIVTSSNLATNLLVDYLGLEEIRNTLQELDVHGVEVQRGVEDERAYEQGISNRVTASGLLSVFRPLVEQRGFSEESCRRMIEILHNQQFNSGIPAGLPDYALVAHKTGEISTVAHDAGIVYLPEREPYVLAVLTQWEPSASGRSETIAKLSRAVYQHLLQEEPDE